MKSQKQFTLNEFFNGSLVGKFVNCKEQYAKFVCNECGEFNVIPFICGKIYCKTCYDQRYHKALKRLFAYKIYSKRLLHFDIGFPKVEYPNKKTKKQQEKILSKFQSTMRKYGYKFVGLRVFDLDEHGHFEHFHYAVLPEKKYLSVKLMRIALEKASSGKVKGFKFHGYRYKEGLFEYFAKRMSGKYGHFPNEVFLADIISYVVYKNYFFNVRKLVVISPKGYVLSCAGLLSVKWFRCTRCGSKDLVFVGLGENCIYEPQKS